MKSKEDCRNFFENLSEFVDGELEQSKEALLQEHLKKCKPCLKYVDSLKKLKKCLKIETENSFELEELLKKCLKKFLSEK